MQYLGRRSAAALAFAMVGSTASCLLTSDFDGLTGHQPTTSSTTSSSGSGGATSSEGGSGGSTSNETGGGGHPTTSTTSTGSSGGGLDCAHPTIDGEFPSTCVLDNFNRADSAMLGVNWFTPAGSTWSIKSKQLYIPGPSMGTESPGAILWGDVMGADQEVFVTFSQFTTMDGELELLLKGQSQAEECDGFQVWYDPSKDPPVVGATECTFDMDNNPVFTQFMDPTPVYEVTFSPGDTFGARFSTTDGSLRAYRNGVLFAGWDASDSIYVGMTGRIGLEADGIADSVSFDDFGGGGK